MMHLRKATIKAAIVLIPSYLAAFLTEQMVYVVPTLAAASFFAGTVDLGKETTQKRIDESDIDQSPEPDEAETELSEELIDLNGSE